MAFDHPGDGQGRELHGLPEGDLALGDGNKPNMIVLNNGKRRAAGLEPPVRVFDEARVCAADGCTTRPSRYSPASCCSLREGWDQQ
jgi:hypothetical protein